MLAGENRRCQLRQASDGMSWGQAHLEQESSRLRKGFLFFHFLFRHSL